MNFGGEEGVGEGGGKGGKKIVSLKLMFFSPSLLPALKSARCPSLAGEFWGLKEGVDSNGVWRAPIMEGLQWDQRASGHGQHHHIPHRNRLWSGCGVWSMLL